MGIRTGYPEGSQGSQYLQKKASKSKSRGFKSESFQPKSNSKSGKNGLESGLESKSGLEYYKSDCLTK